VDPFWEKIVLMLVDKVLLGLVGAGIAYIAALALERYRRDQAMVLELGKLRAQAFVRLMSMLGEHSLLFQQLASGQHLKENEAMRQVLQARAEKFRDEMMTAIPRELAVLDPELRKRIGAYVQALYTELDFRKFDEAPMAKAELDAWMKKVGDLRDAVMELVPRLPKH
jgi:hypothetical protein